MEALFTSDIIINGQNKSFEVFFENEQYVFKTSGEAQPTFSLCREHDEWKISGLTDTIALQQATHALDQYLLSQH
jgi:hypothetical protein